MSAMTGNEFQAVNQTPVYKLHLIIINNYISLHIMI